MVGSSHLGFAELRACWAKVKGEAPITDRERLLRVEQSVTSVSRVGKAACIVLLCLVLATCGSRSRTVDPKRIDATVSASRADTPQVRAFYDARGWAVAWDDEAADQLQKALGDATA